MAVTLDTAFELGAGVQTSPFTTTGTVGSNSNRVGIGYICVRGIASSAVAMTWDSVSMSPIGSLSNTAGGNFDLYLFGIIAPNTGTKTLSASWTGGATSAVCLAFWSLKGADQSTGWQNFASNSGTSTSMTTGAITSANGNMVVGATADNDASSASITSGTSDFDERGFTGNYEGAHIASSGSSATLSWTLGTSVAWATLGVDVIASGAGETITIDKWFRPASEPRLKKVGVVSSGTIGIKSYVRRDRIFVPAWMKEAA